MANMNKNSKNHNKNDGQNVHGLRKVAFWEKYGAKRFPYRGSRRYTPFVFRSEDGGIVISNDVFGLTIRQFERIYKDCLDRRKTQEQFILNLRYPDKTSNEYLEYLKNSTHDNKDFLSCPGNDLKKRCLYEYLLETFGTEIDIRERQKLFIITDMIHNINKSGITKLSSGSLAEGLDLPGSDHDIMDVLKNVDVIQKVRDIKYPIQRTTLLMKTDTDHPGFAKLRLIALTNRESFFITDKCFESTKTGLYLSANKFVSYINKTIHQDQLTVHGPCLSFEDNTVDFASCLKCKYLPYNTLPWLSRYRKQWPPNSTIVKIKQNGCLLVPIGPKEMSDCNILWRLSFSMAEKQLVHSFNFTQLLCYCLLKITLKLIVNTNTHAEGLLCSYFLKTALFWVSEEIDIDTFQLSKLYFCFFLCLDKLILWVKQCYCPNYFIPEQNMFLGKINSNNNKVLLKVMDVIKRNGTDGLIQKLFLNEDGRCRLLKQNESSFIKLDILYCKICTVGDVKSDISQCLQTLMFIKSLITSEYSTFIINVCKYEYAEINQYAAQLLPTPSTTITTNTYNLHKRYHRHLQDGIKTDAVSGWLLYASFYYVTGQFEVTLRLTDYVLSRCSPGMLFLGRTTYNDKDLDNYKRHIHHSMPLCDRIKSGTINYVEYLKNSSLLPRELQHVVICDAGDIFIPPIVMSHCLRFLCFHHLHYISNRQESLHDLYLEVTDKNHVPSNILSDALLVLGVCFQISGDKDAAHQIFDKALKCEGTVGPSAETRKSKLLKM